MKITWFGHACFLIETGDVKILTDPFDSAVGYKIPNVVVDIITESHQHFDHNAHHLIKGRFELVKDPGIRQLKGVKITGVKTFHDSESGTKRGQNIIFTFDVEDIRIAHLGDLGHILNQAQLDQIKPIDVLLLPVGGTFTIGPTEAKRVLDQINPHIAIPMHFKTKYIKFDIAPVEEFTKLCENVKYTSNNILEIDKQIKNQEKLVYVLTL
ncbi:MBL fold metallo-hydrolase [Thermotoga profunda]|uniref:MBL fold metallo-hydrolase n=1 Tax=Thermotoga profunda TaxID=1508420 RepID=UPI0005973B56|nr:MBL fold metallo-hydrolase [Thermotoga profunda]